MDKATPKQSTRHESDKLNALCGKHVKVTFWDETTKEGILRKDTPAESFGIKADHTVIGYIVDNLHFRKSHITRIEEVGS